MTCSFLKNLCRWDRHSGCSALSRTVTRVAPLSGTVTQTVPRENLQIALCSVLFVPAGLSPIQCNFRPSGCSALSRTVTRVAPLSGTVTQTVPLSGTVTQTVPRKNLQIALCSVFFVPAGLSPIQCNS
ncbi:hypothetical protein DY000_02015634 [Brassica cretica]|uniref:Uncharacterized protein n=1 Tax=Brassica cretica TaxID=69181 RepID=A0ABQ7D3G8_BRACR|nr:hypothetical protein DY000_02015634 [Brassica cretica]